MKAYMKVIAAAAAIAITTSSTCVYAKYNGKGNAEKSSEVAEKTDSPKPVKTNEDGIKASKDETVYLLSDAEGNVNKTIVSSRLKNPDGLDIIDDCSELSDIENVKGYETFSQTGNDIIWNAAGEDIYYKGTSDKEAPVSVKISYTLDGKEITPEELAGKSGKVKIRFDYKNTSKKSVKIGNDKKNSDIYTPFLMASTLILDNQKFSNIEVTNGKCVSDGNRSVIIGTALPGLKESLNVSDDSALNIPDYLEITADTAKFSMGETMTVATNSVFNNIEIDDKTDLSELSDSLGELSDASKKLVDGSGDLYDGLKKLYSSTGNLSSGVDNLYSGSLTLQSGIKELSSGLSQVSSGAKTLSDNIGKFADGLYNAVDGANKLSKGAGDMKSGVNSLYEGAKTESAGLSTLSSGLDTAASSLNQTISYNEQVLSGLKQAYTVAPNDSLAAAIGTLEQTISAQKQIAASMSSGGELKSGADNLAAGADKLAEGAAALKDGVSSISSGASTLSDGLNKLRSAIDKIADGGDSLYNASVKVSSGSKKLVSGTGTLVSGTSTLKSGTKSLTDGIKKLRDGSKDLNDGMVEFNETGIQKLVTAFDGDIQGLMDRVSAIAGVSKDYTNFGGISGDMEGSVNFIIKTDSIG